MNEILTALNALRKRLGIESIVLITLSFAILSFGGQLDSDLKKEYSELITIVAGAFFCLGLLIGLLRFVSRLFNDRPARGILDGLAAGLIAGILGGALGYGSHSGPDYDEPGYIRIGLCIMFALPIGGVVGFFIDLLHPDREIPYKRYLSAIILGVSILLSFVGIGLFLFVPTIQNDGIMLGEIQLLFEVFLVVLAIIVVIDRNWSIKKYLLRLPNIVLGILLARLYTTFSVSNSGYDYGMPLYLRQYFSAPEGDVNLIVTVVSFVVWSVAFYGLFYFDHPVNQWATAKFCLSDNER